MPNITELLEKNEGGIVDLVSGRTREQGLLLKDGQEEQTGGLRGWRIIRKGSAPGWYSSVYFGVSNCEVREGGGRAVISLYPNKGYDVSSCPKPDYDCPLRSDIEALETALRNEAIE